MGDRFIVITRADLGTVQDQPGGIVVTGTDDLIGKRVTFTGAREPMLELLDFVRSTGEGTAQIDDSDVIQVQS